MLFTYRRCWMYSRRFMSNERIMCSIIKRIKWWKQWRKFRSKFKWNNNVFKWSTSLWKWTSVVM